MLRVAGVGAGYFSRFHYDAWARIEGVLPVGVADHDPARAAATGLTAFADAGEMLATTRPDILDIITPPAGHLPLIRLGIEAGLRAIICQKPFCRSLQEAEAATALAEAAGIPLIIHENFRFQPWYRAIKAAVEAGRIGDLHQITFRLRPGDGQGPRAYLDRQPYFQTMERFLIHETAVHWIDTFRYLIGEPDAVFADLRQLNPAIAGEDAGTVLFQFPAGRRALFDGNRHLDHAAENTRLTMGEALVEGTRGTLSLSGDGAVTHRAFGARAGETLLPAHAPHPDRFGGDCVFHLQSQVVAGLATGGGFETAARAYLPVLRAEAAIYRSAETGAVVRL